MTAPVPGLPPSPAGRTALPAEPSALVATLAYFAAFQFPLRQEELFAYAHHCPLDRRGAELALRHLLERGVVGTAGGLFFLAGEEASVALRRERTARAQPWGPRVRLSARVLGRVPFVRGICLSGSLSKGTQDEDGDVDLLLITAPGRVHVVSAFVKLLLKPLTRAGRRRFCANYLLGEDHLELPDRNLFVATELVFLKPLLDPARLRALLEANRWVRAFYPNLPAVDDRSAPAAPRPRLLERALAGRLGERLERLALGHARWRTAREAAAIAGGRRPGRSHAELRMAAHEVKDHTHGRQARIRQAVADRLRVVEARHRLTLVRWPWSLEANPADPGAPG